MTTTQKLENAFREALGLEGVRGVSDLQYQDIQEWDSVGHMQLVTEIEMAFDVMLSTEDVIAMSSFKVAQEILQKHGVLFDA